jgi:hypothetical protein
VVKPRRRKLVARNLGEAQAEGRSGQRGSGTQLGGEAKFEFGAELCDFHAGHDDELATQHFAGLVVIGKLADDAAILAILIPAKAAVRNCLGTEELETAKDRVAIGDLDFLPENGDFDKFFVGSKDFGNGNVDDGVILGWFGRDHLRKLRLEQNERADNENGQMCS